MNCRTHTTLAVAVACAMVAAAAGAQEAQTSSALSGVWRLNPRRSDLPRGERHSERRSRFGGDDHGMGGPPEGTEPDDEDTGGGHGNQDYERLLTPNGLIKVEVGANEVRIISGDGHVRIITPDGKPVDRERNFISVTETAKWVGGRIEVTSTDPKGLSIKETLGMSEDGKGWFVHTIELMRPGSNGPRKARWVYEP